MYLVNYYQQKSPLRLFCNSVPGGKIFTPLHLALEEGFEPPTSALTAQCSTNCQPPPLPPLQAGCRHHRSHRFKRGAAEAGTSGVPPQARRGWSAFGGNYSRIDVTGRACDIRLNRAALYQFTCNLSSFQLTLRTLPSELRDLICLPKFI